MCLSVCPYWKSWMLVYRRQTGRSWLMPLLDSQRNHPPTQVGGTLLSCLFIHLWDFWIILSDNYLWKEGEVIVKQTFTLFNFEFFYHIVTIVFLFPSPCYICEDSGFMSFARRSYSHTAMSSVVNLNKRRAFCLALVNQSVSICVFVIVSKILKKLILDMSVSIEKWLLFTLC